MDGKKISIKGGIVISVVIIMVVFGMEAKRIEKNSLRNARKGIPALNRSW